MFETKVKSTTTVELRDWFAVKIAAECHVAPEAEYGTPAHIAIDAYQLADAMMEERIKS